ncbi:hypothetical protein ASD99_01195 [Mesorhizobium sp. Root695]|jgi:hypothetical protein|uniref:hypothetical protein n=1 Tax=unclassified Mesorhizobium TaxID=325217 RepID=UPI0006F3E807|nr:MULTISPECIES: hypothetical protein [unclassified Mesorhizobium]KQU80163.1 hypothetical protein ASD12_12265 [Mesorhizobium sp. Root102]KRB34276.1 hypothetical protein ASD99_01195 [Mesorhizobium sp. Root695]
MESMRECLLMRLGTEVRSKLKGEVEGKRFCSRKSVLHLTLASLFLIVALEMLLWQLGADRPLKLAVALLETR